MCWVYFIRYILCIEFKKDIYVFSICIGNKLKNNKKKFGKGI